MPIIGIYQKDEQNKQAAQDQAELALEGQAPAGIAQGKVQHRDCQANCRDVLEVIPEILGPQGGTEQFKDVASRVSGLKKYHHAEWASALHAPAAQGIKAYPQRDQQGKQVGNQVSERSEIHRPVR